ncbi:MAG: acyltransferase [Candidatus Latescibacteria bacterium]|nr:acyltransferase [Candidatus Latescibacterota bacterium]
MTRNTGLDFIRALAIGLVLMGHVLSMTGLDSDDSFIRLVVFVFLGYAGVEIFFVLSGFLIGRILINNIENNISIFNFWWRRWLRTLPTYLLFLTVNYIIIIYYSWGISLFQIPKYALFIQNLFYPIQQVFFTESWSLAVEEWFYLLIPIVLYSFKNTIQRAHVSLIWILSGLILLFLHIRLFYSMFLNPITDIFVWNSNLRQIVVLRMDSLLVGILGSYVAKYHAGIFNKYKSQLGIIGLCFITFLTIQFFSFSIEGLYFSVFYPVLFSVFVLLVFPYIMPYRFSQKTTHVMGFISKSSYVVYLSHLPILNLMTYYLSEKVNHPVLLVIPWLFVTYGLSYLIHMYFEKPIMDLR